MDSTSLWNWSLLLWRTRTLEVRMHWTLMLWMLFDVVRFAQSQAWWMILAALIVPPVTMYLHAMAHVGMARLVGGSADRTVLALLNDQTSMSIPLTPAKQAAVAGAGPAVSLVLWLGCALIAHLLSAHQANASFVLYHAPTQAETLTYQIASYAAAWNSSVFILNLMACAIFDGARLWRAALWPLFGLARAVRWTVWLSYACALYFIAFGAWVTDALSLLFGVLCLMVTIQEHRSVRLGFDPVLQVEYESVAQGRRPRSWFAQWKARRRLRAEQAREREALAEQDLLDALLAKVSEHGLQALSERERGLLHTISRKQRERQEAEAR
jgi:hypothetical protein